MGDTFSSRSSEAQSQPAHQDGKASGWQPAGYRPGTRNSAGLGARQLGFNQSLLSPQRDSDASSLVTVKLQREKRRQLQILFLEPKCLQVGNLDHWFSILAALGRASKQKQCLSPLAEILIHVVCSGALLSVFKNHFPLVIVIYSQS